MALLAGPEISQLMKPHFRQLGHSIVEYTDGTLLISDNKRACEVAVEDTRAVLTELGFTLNEKKSVCMPTQEIVFLGLLADDYDTDQGEV